MGPVQSHESFKVGDKGRREEQRGSCVVEKVGEMCCKKDLPSLALKMRKGPLSRGMWAASKSKKKQRNGFPI